MMETVDLVVAGEGGAARAAAVETLQRGQRVLVVLRPADARVARRLRRSLLETSGADGGQLRVMTNAEIACVDGIDGVEAVVVRHVPTGRLSAVNASAFVSFGTSSHSRRPRGRNENEPGSE
jgi:shikimate 5-dehydrogenase